MPRIARAVLFSAISIAFTSLGVSKAAAQVDQNALNSCTAMLQSMSDNTLTTGVPSVCSRLADLRSTCNRAVDGMGDKQVKNIQPLCDSKVREERDRQEEQARRRSQERTPAPQTAPPAAPKSSAVSLKAATAARQQGILSALPTLLTTSLSRSKFSPEDFQSLLKMAKDLGEAYVERKKGSVLAYTTKQDTALADARGYRRRESPNFVVFYRTGDMNRAQTTLTNAEASVDPIRSVLHHFPTIDEQRGRKLPIYLTQTQEAYTQQSHCAKVSIACVTHTVFDDGSISTMYISPHSYEMGVKADDRIADFKKTVQHELTHYAQFDMLTAKTAGRIPTWFVEGLASYVAGESERITALSSGQAPGQKLLSFQELQAGESDIYNSGNAILYYEEGYSIFEYLVATQGVQATSSLIVDVSQSESFEDALQTTMGLSPVDFDQQWRDYLQRSHGVIIAASNNLATPMRESSASGVAAAELPGVAAAQEVRPILQAIVTAITRQGTVRFPPIRNHEHSYKYVPASFDVNACKIAFQLNHSYRDTVSLKEVQVADRSVSISLTDLQDVKVGNLGIAASLPQGSPTTILSLSPLIVDAESSRIMFYERQQAEEVKRNLDNARHLCKQRDAATEPNQAAQLVNAVQSNDPSLAATTDFMQKHVTTSTPIVGNGTIGGKRHFETSVTWTSYRIDGCRVIKRITVRQVDTDPTSGKLVASHEDRTPSDDQLGKLKPNGVKVTDMANNMESDARQAGEQMSVAMIAPLYLVGFQDPSESTTCNVIRHEGREPKFPPNEHPEDWDCKSKVGITRNTFFVTPEKVLAERFSKALVHAIQLCGGTNEAF